MNEIRIIICGWLFTIISWLAPGDTKEGRDTLEVVWLWCDKMDE